MDKTSAVIKTAISAVDEQLTELTTQHRALAEKILSFDAERETISREIQRLQQARRLLAGGSVQPGRPRHYHQTAETRAKIAAAQKKRWAAAKDATKNLKTKKGETHE